MVVMSTLLSIGLANLKHVDMTSSRNLLVLGIPFMAGIVVPMCLTEYPDLIKTGGCEVSACCTNNAKFMGLRWSFSYYEINFINKYFDFTMNSFTCLLYAKLMSV